MYQNIFIENGTEEGSVVHIWDDETGYSCFNYQPFNYAYEVNKSGKMVSLYGQKVKKVHRWADNSSGIFESDVPQSTRVLTDLYQDDDTPSKNHHVMFADIETSMKEGIPNVEKAQNPILSIATYSKNTNKYMVFALDENAKLKDIDNIDGTELYAFRTEEEMLEAFLLYYQDANPTILSGWNSDYFDVPYLYRRLEVVFDEETANKLSPIGKLKWSGFKQKWHVAGVATLDYMVLYKKFTYSQRPNYRLDSIGEFELNLKKVSYEGTLDEFRERDIVEFLRYNIRDVEILVKLDDKLKLIELVRGICHVGHVSYEDFSYSSRFLEGTILTYLHRKGVVCPNKPTGGREEMDRLEDEGEQGFEGAYVKEPFPGRYEWVYSLDLQSLYPSIIMSLNISPETKVGKIVNWDVEKHIKKSIVTYEIMDMSGLINKLPAKEFYEFMDEGKFAISSNGILYRTDVVGIIPEVLDKWFAERIQYKKLMKQHLAAGNAEQADYYDRRQHIQKIFLNSLYGVLGLPIFRFYDVDNALAVTASGQDVIRTSAKYVNAQYTKLGAKPRTDAWLAEYQSILNYDAKVRGTRPETAQANDHCIYIDTDSLYFSSLPTWSIQDKKEYTIECAKRFEKELNEFYEVAAHRLFNITKHRFTIKGESVADAGFWVTKKRYALHKIYDLETNTDVDKMTVKGLDIVRSSFPQAFREFMTEILIDILQGIGKDVIDTKVLEFRERIHSMPINTIARNTACKEISKYKVKKASLNEFIKGTPAHIKAALVYNRLLTYFKQQNKNESIEDGAKIKWVYLKDNPLHISEVAFKDYDDPKQIMDYIIQHIDYDMLFDSEFKKKLQNFYDALKWGKISTEVNQKANDFFSF